MIIEFELLDTPLDKIDLHQEDINEIILDNLCDSFEVEKDRIKLLKVM